MEKIAVLGAGTMGAGIAQLIAQSGYEVYLRDIKEDYVEEGLEKIKNSLDYLVEKEKLEQRN
ncbi:3-hydroxyacyl-CoA dehydrogenase NAD-binding domain-containing protein [Halanaerobacter jeridensis]|uniref:3-hydroxyacyl-CoA dehydrogenase n=1 Tax=Halanaerobacter jeridensis TaxID=706427 RepID=A0A938XSR8_9FIRM|nr:3-hydroxyacyl-CoA dehydrogenase NAD-binding domain-containing protein [Halanaerobacter jeridensis]MBM7556825.1 3-hydroxyacyl-CoA dehydrogenase [Halanaerobacter jeridensis]